MAPDRPLLALVFTLASLALSAVHAHATPPSTARPSTGGDAGSCSESVGSAPRPSESAVAQPGPSVTPSADTIDRARCGGEGADEASLGRRACLLGRVWGWGGGGGCCASEKPQGPQRWHNHSCTTADLSALVALCAASPPHNMHSTVDYYFESYSHFSIHEVRWRGRATVASEGW